MDPHTIFKIIMLFVGVVMIGIYADLQGLLMKQSVMFKGDNQEEITKNVLKFSRAIAGILSLGSMFVAFSVSSLVIGSSTGGANYFGLYMLIMAVIGVVSIGLVSTAISSIDKDRGDKLTDNTETAWNRLVTVDVFAVIATIAGIAFAVKPDLLTKIKDISNFGFDFEF